MAWLCSQLFDLDLVDFAVRLIVFHDLADWVVQRVLPENKDGKKSDTGGRFSGAAIDSRRRRGAAVPRRTAEGL